MVGQMTYGRRQWDEFDSQMRKLIPVVTDASADMIKMIDADTDAFNDYMVGNDIILYSIVSFVT
jgi:glutamate formiminotransferase/formiminotetrahydrofolate cyclodeaminase